MLKMKCCFLFWKIVCGLDSLCVSQNRQQISIFIGKRSQRDYIVEGCVLEKLL